MLFEEMSSFRKIFGEKDNRSIEPEYYKWKIYDNPSRPGFIHLEMKEGVIAGSATITPKTLLVEGRKTPGAEIGDTFTYTDFRRQGIFSRCVRSCTDFCLQSEISVIYGAPNYMSLPGYKEKLNYPPCPNAGVVSMSKYIGLKAIQNKIARKTGVKWRLLTWFPAMIYRRIFYSSAKSGIENNDNVGIASIRRFPDGIDGYWGSARTDFVFFVKRDSAYLNWRFFDNPDDYIVYLANDTDGNPLGYIAAKLTRTAGMNICTICDFITFQDDMGVFAELISSMERNFKKWAVDSASLCCSRKSPYYETLLKSGYIQSGNVPVIVHEKTDLGKIIINSGLAWHFTISDSDNF